MGSALNNTGQAIEIIAMTLAVYLVIGLAVSAFMNWYNARHRPGDAMSAASRYTAGASACSARRATRLFVDAC